MPSAWVSAIRRAARSLLADRSVTLIAVASLAIGIAANATIFSLVQAVEFPRLIYPQASRVVFLESRDESRALIGMGVSGPDALDIAAAAQTLESPSLAADQASVLREGDGPRRISGRRVSPPFFTVMSVAPQHGRVLTAGDRGGEIVLGDGLWRDAFAADPAIVGRAVRIDGGVVTVVGVMPPKFDADADFWTLLDSTAGFARDDRQLTLFARLAPRASLSDATREIEAISRRLAVDHPATNRSWVSYPIPMTRLHGSDSRGSFLMLQAAVAVVLLIACANIANILLARGTRRRHEMALRLSLGATRGRLVRELLGESVLLAIVGGAAGVTLAMWGIRFARATGGFPEVIDPKLNGYVLAFTAGLTMLTGILCGIVPALRASSVAPAAVLTAEGGRSGATSRGALRHLLVAVQVAAAVVLVTCGSLMVRSLANRDRVDLGFDPGAAVRADVAMFGGKYQDPNVVRAAVDAMLASLHASAAIEAAGAVTFALPTPAGGTRVFTLPGDPGTASVPGGVEAVTPRYFDALGVPRRRGRAFTPADAAGAEPVAIVNDRLAQALWPGRDPIGETLRLGAPGQGPLVTVVGIVATTRRSRMHDTTIARAYVPYAQYPGGAAAFVVRGRGAPNAAAQALAQAVHQADAGLLVENARTVEDDLARFIAPIKLITTLLAAFGATGLLLATLGVFGTMSYAVTQREREMAVRAALGAGRRDLVRLVLRSGLRVTVAGLIPGAVISLFATRALSSLLFGVTPRDPWTLALAVVSLGAVSLAACYRPARRAASVDPMEVLRRG